MLKKLIDFTKFNIKYLLQSYSIKNLKILKNFFCQKIIIKTQKKTLFQSYLISKKINYQSNSRNLNAFIEGAALIDNINNQTKKKLNILMVCYEKELYIPKILYELGYQIDVYFFDLKVNKEDLDQDFIQKINFFTIEDDIRNINKYFQNPFFDYIFSSRAGIERFRFDECIEITKKLTLLLKDYNSYLILHVINVFLHKNFCECAQQKKISKIYTSEGLSENNNNHNYINLYSSDLHLSEEKYLDDLTYFIKNFNKKINNEWLEKFFINKKRLNKDDVVNIASSYTFNKNRVKLLSEFSKETELFSTYFKLLYNKLYICSYLKIKK